MLTTYRLLLQQSAAKPYALICPGTGTYYLPPPSNAQIRQTCSYPSEGSPLLTPTRTHSRAHLEHHQPCPWREPSDADAIVLYGPHQPSDMRAVVPGASGRRVRRWRSAQSARHTRASRVPRGAVALKGDAVHIVHESCACTAQQTQTKSCACGENSHPSGQLCPCTFCAGLPALPGCSCISPCITYAHPPSYPPHVSRISAWQHIT